MATSLAILVVLTGLMALFAGLLGSILWVDGKPKGQIPSVKLRLVVGAVGLGLIGLGVWINYQTEQTHARPDADLLEKIKSLEARVAKITTDATEMASRSRSQQLLVTQLQEDQRVISARTGLVASGQVRDDECDRALRRAGRDWEPKAGSMCQRMLHSMWTIEVLVPLAKLDTQLKQRLKSTGLRITMADPKAEHSGAATPGLGIIFPDDAPRSIVCQVRNAFLAVVGVDLAAATTTSISWRSGSAGGPSHAIRVGVPFNDHFAAGYPTLTQETWQHLCGNGYDGVRFTDYFQNQSGKYRPRDVSTEVPEAAHAATE